MKLKNILFQACALAGGTIILSSCNDFLDREPLSSVTPEVYFSTTDHFEAYSIAKYNNCVFKEIITIKDIIERTSPT